MSAPAANNATSSGGTHAAGAAAVAASSASASAAAASSSSAAAAAASSSASSAPPTKLACHIHGNNRKLDVARSHILVCTTEGCGLAFCKKCREKFPDPEIMMATKKDFRCPRCRNNCCCKAKQKDSCSKRPKGAQTLDKLFHAKQLAAATQIMSNALRNNAVLRHAAIDLTKEEIGPSSVDASSGDGIVKMEIDSDAAAASSPVPAGDSAGGPPAQHPMDLLPSTHLSESFLCTVDLTHLLASMSSDPHSLDDNVPLTQLRGQVQDAIESVNADPGITTMLGPQGAGKTTTANLLIRRLTPSNDIYKLQAHSYINTVPSGQEFWRQHLPLDAAADEADGAESDSDDEEESPSSLDKSSRNTSSNSALGSGSSVSAKQAASAAVAASADRRWSARKVDYVFSWRKKTECLNDCSEPCAAFESTEAFNKLSQVDPSIEEFSVDDRLSKAMRELAYKSTTNDIIPLLTSKKVESGYLLPLLQGDPLLAAGSTKQLFRVRHGPVYAARITIKPLAVMFQEIVQWQREASGAGKKSGKEAEMFHHFFKGRKKKDEFKSEQEMWNALQPEVRAAMGRTLVALGSATSDQSDRLYVRNWMSRVVTDFPKLVTEVLVWTPARLSRELVDCPGTMESSAAVRGLTERAIRRAKAVIAFVQVNRAPNEGIMPMLLSSGYLQNAVLQGSEYSLMVVTLPENDSATVSTVLSKPLHAMSDDDVNKFILKSSEAKVNKRQEMQQVCANSLILEDEDVQSAMAGVSPAELREFCLDEKRLLVEVLHPFMWYSLSELVYQPTLQADLKRNQPADFNTVQQMYASARHPDKLLHRLDGMDQVLRLVSVQPAELLRTEMRELIDSAKQMLAARTSVQVSQQADAQQIEDTNTYFKQHEKSILASMKMPEWLEPKLKDLLKHKLDCKHAGCRTWGSSNKDMLASLEEFVQFRSSTMALLGPLQTRIKQWFEAREEDDESLESLQEGMLHPYSELEGYLRGLRAMGFQTAMDDFLKPGGPWTTLGAAIKTKLDEFFKDHFELYMQKQWKDGIGKKWSQAMINRANILLSRDVSSIPAFVVRTFLPLFRKDVVGPRGSKQSFLDVFTRVVEDDQFEPLEKIKHAKTYKNLRDICTNFARQYLEDLVYQTEVHLHKLFFRLQRYLSSQSVSLPSDKKGAPAKQTRDPFGKLVRSVIRALLSERAEERSIAVNEDKRIVDALEALHTKLHRWNKMPVMERVARDLISFDDVDSLIVKPASAAASSSTSSVADDPTTVTAAPASAINEVSFSKLLNPRGDGHCFFRALSLCLTLGATQGYHPLLREWIAGELARDCEWYLTNPETVVHLPDSVIKKLNANQLQEARAAMYDFIFGDANRADQSVLGKVDSYGWPLHAVAYHRLSGRPVRIYGLNDDGQLETMFASSNVVQAGGRVGEQLADFHLLCRDGHYLALVPSKTVPSTSLLRLQSLPTKTSASSAGLSSPSSGVKRKDPSQDLDPAAAAMPPAAIAVSGASAGVASDKALPAANPGSISISKKIKLETVTGPTSAFAHIRSVEAIPSESNALRGAVVALLRSRPSISVNGILSLLRAEWASCAAAAAASAPLNADQEQLACQAIFDALRMLIKSNVIVRLQAAAGAGAAAASTFEAEYQLRPESRVLAAQAGS